MSGARKKCKRKNGRERAGGTNFHDDSPGAIVDYATIAVGCTGGKHRSVAIVEELAKRLSQQPRVTVTTAHRDLGRE